MPNIPLDKDMNEPLIREPIRVVKKVNGELITEYRDVTSGNIQEDDLLEGIDDNDTNGAPSGIGIHMEGRPDYDYIPPSRASKRSAEDIIQGAAENSQRFLIIKNAIKSVVKLPEVKAELTVDWYEDREYQEVIAEAVIDQYGGLGFSKQEVINTINQIYN